jgi:cytochrome P450
VGQPDQWLRSVTLTGRDQLTEPARAIGRSSDNVPIRGARVTTFVDLPTLPFDDPSLLEISPQYRRLQDKEPISRVRTPVGDPAWLVTRYDDVKALLADERLGRSHPDPMAAPRYAAGIIAGGPIMDPATERNDRGHVRRMTSRPFASRRIDGLRPLVESIVRELVEGLVRMGPPVDLHAAFSNLLPELVVCRLFGLPHEDRRIFGPPARDTLLMQDSARTLTALADLTGYVQALIEQKRRNPDEHLLSELIAMADGRELNEGLLMLMVDAVFIAGKTTMTSRLELATLLLLEDREQFERLVGDPALVPDAAEEALRLTPPTWELLLRYAKTDIDCGGVTIEAGDLVLLSLASANRDPRVFGDPDRFDITRSPNPHLAFGHGPASCLGAALARVQMQATFSILLPRLPTMRLAVPVQDLEPRRDLLAGGLVSLPVTW